MNSKTSVYSTKSASFIHNYNVRIAGYHWVTASRVYQRIEIIRRGDD